MPDATAKEAVDTKVSGSARGLRVLIALLVSIILPSAIYAIYVLGQLEHVREHNLRGLEDTAQAVTELLDNTRTTVDNFGKNIRNACEFFQRQPRARLMDQDCKDLKTGDAIDPKKLYFDGSSGTLEIHAELKSGNSLRVAVRVDALLEQMPFGSVFDRLVIVDDQGKVLGGDITPQRSSPMLPPSVAAAGNSSPPVRVLDLAKLKFVGDTKETPIGFAAFGASTLVHPVILGGTRYTLMCQPWSIRTAHGLQTWRLCGFIDGQRAFQQALDVAPEFIILLLALFTLAVISWPLLKILSIAPRERIRFADIFLMLLATLALVMMLSVGVADLGTYARLRELSQTRLQRLAGDIETNMRTEFARMHDQLRNYDQTIAAKVAIKPDLLNSKDTTGVSCLLLHVRKEECQRGGTELANELTPPTLYQDLQTVYWMRPCDGLQFIKGTIFPWITPSIQASGREYFEAVKRDRLWPAGSDGSEHRFVVDTFASNNTGEFAAALAIESAIEARGSSAGCSGDESKHFAAAIAGRPVSFRYPVLAPGVGFAVIDQAGHVRFHSDERRAAHENLLDDEGLADRLRAALAARTDASFHAHYQTRPHQVYVHPLQDIPWAIVTFADDEVLRTQHIEMLTQAAILIVLYLLIALIGTLVYVLVHGREPPLWVWPRRAKKYRVLYANTVWMLGTQLILFLLALDVLRGEVLVLACLLLPLCGVLTLVVAARHAQSLDAPSPNGESPEEQLADVTDRFRRSIALVLMLDVALLVGLMLMMNFYYQVAAAQIDIGPGTAALAVLLLVVFATGAIGERFKGRPRSWKDGQILASVRWWRDPLRPHIVAVVTIWFVVGALPAYGLYKFAMVNEMTVASMSEQAYLARAFAWRACKMQDDLRKLPAVNSDAERQGTTSAQSSADSNRPYSDTYLRALLSRNVEVTATRPKGSEVRDGAVGRYFWQYIANLAPIYNETTTYSRYFEHTVPADNLRFSWVKPAGEGANPVLLSKLDAGVCDPSTLYVTSRLPMREPHLSLINVLVALGFISLLFAWATFTARRLFFGGIEIEARRTQDDDDAALSLVVQPERLDLPPDLPWVKSEVRPIFDPYLRFSDDTLKELCASYTTRRAVVDRILEQGRSFYAAEWKKCNEEEKLLLIQLVEEGFANPKQIEIVRRLMKRGLILRDPALRPMNESFALFVEGRARPEDIRNQETVHSGMRWSLVRNFLIGAVLLILIFLSVTQRDVVEVWIAYLGTAAAGVGGVMKIFSMLGRSGSQKLN